MPETAIPQPSIPSTPPTTTASPMTTQIVSRSPLFRLLITLTAVLLISALAFGAYQLGRNQTPSSPIVEPPTLSPSTNMTANWKIYTNTKYEYQLNYPATAEIVIPNLADRQLIEDGKLSIESLKDIQFREETPYSFWFVAQILGNEKNLSPEQFIDGWIEMGKKNPGNGFEYTDRSNISLNAGKIAHLTTHKWHASGTNQNVLVKTLFYPLKGNILSLSFSGYNTDDKTETATIENKIRQIINSLEEIN